MSIADCCLFRVRGPQVTTKQVKVNKHCIARRQWAKFGDCKGLPPGPEQNITYQSFELIHLGKGRS